MISKRKIIDSHLHLDSRIPGDASQAVLQLDKELAESGIERGVVLHLQVQRWPVEEVGNALSQSKRLVGMINVHPFDEDAGSQLRRGIEELGFVGLKLHPRLQSYNIDDPRTHELIRLAGEMNVPTVIDAFPDGDWLMQGFDPLAFARLAKSCPESRMVFAHFGGHQCIDMMMLAKRLPNVWLDLSFSLLYFRGSSVVKDLLYCCESLKFNRVMYGSDYPDRSIAESLDGSLEQFETHGIDEQNLELLLYRNAEELFSWPQN